MASDNPSRGKKRSKAFYRKSAFGGKRQCTGKNVLEPGIRGFLVMCHSNESSAVRESYNILNEYADILYGPEKTPAEQQTAPDDVEGESGSDDDCEDIEKALKKEVDGLKSIPLKEKRFQNVATKAKNLVFIRTTVEDPVKVVTTVMEDIASRKLKRARYAARMLPIIGTCKAQTAAIAELAKDTLASYFSQANPDVPSCFTIMFKARNNSGTTCGKESVIPAVKHEILTINPDMKFAWSDYDVAILVEVVCTTCCLSLAPGYDRLRKFNFQELAQGPRLRGAEADNNKLDASELMSLDKNKGIGKEDLQSQNQVGNSSVSKSEEDLSKKDQEKPLQEVLEENGGDSMPGLSLGELIVEPEKVDSSEHSSIYKTQSESDSLDARVDVTTMTAKTGNDILDSKTPTGLNDMGTGKPNNASRFADVPSNSEEKSLDTNIEREDKSGSQILQS